MERIKNHGYVKRTQKDYTMNFKFQVVQEVESGEWRAFNKRGITKTWHPKSWDGIKLGQKIWHL